MNDRTFIIVFAHCAGINVFGVEYIPSRSADDTSIRGVIFIGRCAIVSIKD